MQLASHKFVSLSIGTRYLVYNTAVFIPHLRVIWAEHPQKGLIFGLLTCLIFDY